MYAPLFSRSLESPPPTFSNDRFDWEVETVALLHPMCHWPQALAEMAQEDRYGVLNSATIKIG